MLLSKYPGMTAGLARLARVEDILRAAAMLPLQEEMINGIAVQRLTAHHYEQLLLARSPFLTGLGEHKPREFRQAIGIEVSPERVAQALWVISPFNPLNRRTWQRVLSLCNPLNLSGCQRVLEKIPFRYGSLRAHFLREIWKTKRYDFFERAIDRYLARAFFDRPPNGNGRIMPVAVSASIVNKIAAAYGWDDEVLDFFGLPVPGKGIMDMPLSRLFQYWRWISADKNPAAPLYSSKRDDFQQRTSTKWRKRAQAAGYEDDPPGQRRLEGVEKYLIAIRKLPVPPWFAASHSSQPSTQNSQLS